MIEAAILAIEQESQMWRCEVDWTTTAITLGSNFFIAITAIVVGISAPSMQIRRERERDRKERKREIKGQPLLRLKEELSSACAKEAFLFAMFAGQNPVGYKEAYEDLRNFKKRGDFMKTLYMLDDKKIIDQVDSILDAWAAYPANPLEADMLVNQMTEKIRQVQSLIDARLLDM